MPLVDAPRHPDWHPLPLAGLEPGHPAREELEIRDLLALRDAGVEVAPIVVVPAAAEARFYRWNNLSARLAALFARVDLADPDEDDLEELAPAAEALLREHFLLDETVDAFYESTSRLPPRLRVRRPGGEGRPAGRGRPALLALKRAWADAWSAEALEDRLRSGFPLVPDPRPVLVHGDPLPASPPEAAAVREALGVRAAFVVGRGVVRLAH